MKANSLVLLSRLAAFALLGQVTSLQRCTSTDIQSGSMDGDTFIPPESCYFGIPDASEMKAILRGSWLIMCGGSNGWLQAQTIANQLEPRSFLDVDVRSVPSDSAKWADIIWKQQPDGSYIRVYRNVRGPSIHNRDFTSIQQSLDDASAIAHTDGSIRLTFIQSRFYPECTELLGEARSASAAGSWSGTRHLVWTIIGVWYSYAGSGALANAHAHVAKSCV